jgi:hypothetical protein
MPRGLRVSFQRARNLFAEPASFALAGSNAELYPGEGAATGFIPEPGFWAFGAFNDGGTITVTRDGGGFGTKVNAKPMYLWDARTGTVASSPLSRHAFTPNNFLPKTFDTSFGLNGRGTLRAALRPPPGGTGGDAYRVDEATAFGFFDMTLDGGPPPRITIFNRTYRNWGGRQAYQKVQQFRALGLPDNIIREWNIKDSRWYAGTSGTSQNNMWYGYGQQNSDAGNPRFSWERMGTSATSRDLPGMIPNAWRTDYAVMQQSSGPDVFDSFIKVMQNDRYGEVLNRRSRNAQYPGEHRRLASIQYQFIYTDEDWFDWWDIFYLDDTGHAALLTDGEWGAPGTKYEICIPVAWADDAVQLNLRSGEWGTTSGKTLWIIRDDGTRYKALRII